MRFKALEDFRHDRLLLEAGNSYDSVKHGIPDDAVERFYASGWAEIEGREPPPERKPGAQTIRPAKAAHEGSK